MRPPETKKALYRKGYHHSSKEAGYRIKKKQNISLATVYLTEVYLSRIYQNFSKISIKEQTTQFWLRRR